MPIEEAAARLAPVFTRRGYAFFYPFRRGHGPSADAGPFLQASLAEEERTHGRDSRQALQNTLLQPEQLEDVRAALTFLRRAPGIDPARLVVAGHSSGGQLALLAAAEDPALRAAVTFAAAAGSWSRSPDLQRVLRDAVRRARCPIMLVQWANDFSTAPSIALDEELARWDRPHLLAVYPPVGRTPEDGHAGLYLRVADWEPDVLRFLEEAAPR